MEYRRLGNTELNVSVVAMGCWAIGGDVDFWGPVDDNESIAAIQRGLDEGINLIDTAAAYGCGHSEEIVGKAVAGRREQAVIATKCGLVWRLPGGRKDRCLQRDSVLRECEASLRRLRVETIDLYQIHWPDPHTPLAETMETLSLLRSQGKIRAVGVSNFGIEELSEARRHGGVDCLQPELSMLERQAREDLLPYCREYGIGVMAYGPMARGLLTGKFDAASQFHDLRARDARYQGEAYRRNLRLVESLGGLAERKGCTIAQIALRWVIDQAGVTAAIAGAKRGSQVAENAGAGRIRLSAEELDEIERLLESRDANG